MTPMLAVMVAVGLILGGALLLWRASRPVAGVPSRWLGRRNQAAQTAPTPPPEWIYGDRTPPKSQTSSATPRPAGVAKIPEPASEATEPERNRSVPADAIGDQIVIEAELKAREIVAAAELERERLLSEARASLERANAELSEARHEADALVKEAEEKTRDMLAVASSAQAQLNQAIAREQALVEEKRRLFELVFGMLKELDRTSDLDAANVRDLGEARELRGHSRSVE